jgi:adenylate cyclase
MRFERAMLLTAVAACAAGVGVAVAETDVLGRWEHDTLAARFDVRGARAPDAQVAVVGVDEERSDRWPFPRSEQARFIERLRAMGPRLIVYDIQITDRSDDPDGDLALYDAISAARPVVMATTETDPQGNHNVFGGEEFTREAGIVVGSGLLPPRFERVPLEADGLPTLAARATTLVRGRPPARDMFRDGGAWIAYAGPPGTVPTVSWEDVMRRRERAERTLGGKIVVVGLTAPVLQDVHLTPAPGDRLMSGPEIQANAIATALRDAPLRSVAPGVDLALVLGLAFAVPLLALGWALRALLAVPLLAAAHLAGAQIAFGADRVVEVLPALVALGVAAAGTAAALLATEIRRRRVVRTTLARFAPDPIVDDVLARAEAGGGRLPPVELDATVLFCDLRGFTTFAEQHAVSVVIDTLDRHLGQVADAVMAHGGTIVAYLGDGAMAVFGAPSPQDDHADRALAAARELAGPRFERLNAWLAERRIDYRFAIGVGLHSGPVMSGTVGSERRIEYAAVGDTTNVAARLQAATKEAGVPVLLSDATRARLSTQADLHPLGEVRLRGREAPLMAWTLEGYGSSPKGVLHAEMPADTLAPDEATDAPG